jgi:AraC-like DNA-binding protein
VALLHERLEFLTAAGPVLVSQYLEKKLCLDAVELMRPKPENTQAWDQAFGTKVRWGRPISRYVVSHEQAHRQVLTRNEPLKKELQLLLDKRLRQDKTAHPVDEVRTVMLKQLATQLPTTESVAESLHISTRTLHRRLADADTSFSALLAGELEDMAKHYISLGMPAREVAEQLRYTDIRTFNRAFKRWTGQTPNQYFKQQEH